MRSNSLQMLNSVLGNQSSRKEAGRRLHYLPRLRNLLPNMHHRASDGATGLKQHSGATGASFAQAGLMPKWRRANCITNWLKTACFPLVCRQQWPGRKARLDRVQNLRRVCDILRLSFELRQQHWHCPQTSRQSIEFQNVQPGSQIVNLKENALVTQRISGLCGSKGMY